MSFKVNWPKFSQEFLISAQEKLSEALNKGEEKPPNIADRIIVQDLYMGAKPPELEILEIGDLSEDRFKGVFKLTYTGDGFIVMQTKVQVSHLMLFVRRKGLRSVGESIEPTGVKTNHPNRQDLRSEPSSCSPNADSHQ